MPFEYNFLSLFRFLFLLLNSNTNQSETYNLNKYICNRITKQHSNKFHICLFKKKPEKKKSIFFIRKNLFDFQIKCSDEQKNYLLNLFNRKKKKMYGERIDYEKMA